MPDRQHVVGGRQDAGARRFVPGQHRPARPAAVHQRSGRAEERVAGEVGDHVALAAVAELGVGAGVAQEPHGPQVQHDRLAGGADPLRSRARRVQGGERVGAVGLEVPEAGPRRQRGLDPARGTGHRDPPAVVLDHHEQGQRDPGVHGVAGGVERTHCRRVVDRRVAEAGHHDGVLGPRGRHADPGGAVQREGEADRAGQVRGDRGGLGDHVQRRVAEDLVPPSGDRLVAGGGQPEQHVADRVDAGHLRGPGAVEATRAVVQQRRVSGSQRHRDGRVALVARGADRVVADASRVQIARHQVQVPAQRLRLEEPFQLVEVAARRAGRRQRRGRRTEVLVEARRHPTHDAGLTRTLLDRLRPALSRRTTASSRTPSAGADAR